jgi:hypothetical protein
MISIREEITLAMPPEVLWPILLTRRLSHRVFPARS